MVNINIKVMLKTIEKLEWEISNILPGIDIKFSKTHSFHTTVKKHLSSSASSSLKKNLNMI